MGQQQLLLLVLSTVIVGLATVAGIQAFSENQKQANIDALSQRALSIGNDIYSASQKPSALGGVDLKSASASKLAAAAGFDNATGITVDGATGSDPKCDITNGGGSSSVPKVKCGTNGATGGQKVVAQVKTSGPNITKINGQPVGS